ncbi:hypothetical protein U9M48_031523 [Paspalum notatum var. saurae]|uniref:Uncharacterized protein n=1 Tax=Paspalum notatum var. saurae TaxID=547442 RepID=A0AAQ3U2R5_PASNO
MMDNTSDAGHEDLDFYFDYDDDDMVLNENLAPRPSEVNSLPVMGSNDEDLNFHLGNNDGSNLGDGNWKDVDKC